MKKLKAQEQRENQAVTGAAGNRQAEIPGVKAIKIPTVPDGENEAELCGGMQWKIHCQAVRVLLPHAPDVLGLELVY